MPRWPSCLTLGALGVIATLQPAAARVAIRVDLTTQTMQVDSATGHYAWPISSARSGFSTPRGTFGVQRMEAMHHSRQYFNAPMPHSLFFSGGYAIHGTDEVASLGNPASHGCIRLAPRHAATLYRMVAAEGGRISITGSAPDVDPPVVEHRSRSRYAAARTYRPMRGGDWSGEVDNTPDDYLAPAAYRYGRGLFIEPFDY